MAMVCDMVSFLRGVQAVCLTWMVLCERCGPQAEFRATRSPSSPCSSPAVDDHHLFSPLLLLLAVCDLLLGLPLDKRCRATTESLPGSYGSGACGRPVPPRVLHPTQARVPPARDAADPPGSRPILLEFTAADLDFYLPDLSRRLPLPSPPLLPHLLFRAVHPPLALRLLPLHGARPVGRGGARDGAASLLPPRAAALLLPRAVRRLPHPAHSRL